MMVLEVGKKEARGETDRRGKVRAPPMDDGWPPPVEEVAMGDAERARPPAAPPRAARGINLDMDDMFVLVRIDCISCG